MNQRILNDLLPENSADAIWSESLQLFNDSFPGINTDRIFDIFTTTIHLFNGDFPGYRACSTGYHDLNHAIGVYLTLARMIHGAVQLGISIPEDQVLLAISTALLHDVGYILRAGEGQGSGARFKAVHEQRSMDFLARHGPDLGFSESDIATGRNLILCTRVTADIDSIPFPDKISVFLGRLLATADLLSQLSDQVYLEKLTALYREDVESSVGQFKDELDVVHKAVGFCDFFYRRLDLLLPEADNILRSHFSARWNTNSNLYFESIDRQKNYLLRILQPASDPRQHIRRWGTVERLGKAFNLPLQSV